MLAEADDPAERRSVLATVEREVARLDRLLGGVRGIARIDAGLDTEPLVAVDLATLPAALVPVHRATGRERPVTVSLALPLGPLPVLAAPERLVGLREPPANAGRLPSPPGATVAVIARQEGATVVVDVDDAGPGIPPSTASGSSTASSRAGRPAATSPTTASASPSSAPSSRATAARSRRRIGPGGEPASR